MRISTQKNLLTNLILLIVSLLLTAAVMELGLRLADPLGRAELGLLIGIRPESNYEADEKLNYRPRDPLYFWDDKDHPPTPEKPAGVVRIFALGDSFTKAHGNIGAENSFYHQLERKIQGLPGAPAYQFFHFGVSGYSEVQYLELLRRYGPQYHPDWAIIQVYLGNDVGENAGLIVRQLAMTPEGQLAITDTPPASGAAEVSAWQQFLRWAAPARWSYLYRFVEERWPVLLYRLRKAEASSPPATSVPVQSSPPTALANINTGPHFISLMQRRPLPEIEHAWQVTDQLLADIVNEGQRQHIRLIFVLIPQELQVNQPAWEEAVGILGLDPTAYDRDLPSQRFSALLTKYKIPVIDLTPGFRAAITAGTDLYDGHFNRAGHDLATELILQGLVKLNEKIEQ